MTELHPVTVAVEPLFANSSLDSRIVDVCRRAFDEYLEDNIFFTSNDFVEAMNALYSLNDGKTYRVLQIDTDSKATYFLMPCKQGLRFAISHSGYRYLKESGNFNEKVFPIEAKNIATLTNALMTSLNKTLTCMKRVATGIKDEVEVEYPPIEILQRFYECGRKIPYDSHADVVDALWDYNDAYRCRHCGKYHQGKTPSESESIDDETRLKRFQRVWRYMHNLGEFRHKADKISQT